MRTDNVKIEFSNGHVYDPWEDVGDDNIKIWHDVTLPSGKKLSVDWSPYELMTKEDLEVWAELGYPERIGAGPLTREDLDTLEFVDRFCTTEEPTNG